MLQISDQKNGHVDACLHHKAMPDAGPLCVVMALGGRVVHVRVHSRKGNTLVCSYWDQLGQGNVMDGQIRFAVKFSGRLLVYPVRDIPLNRLDTHSLQAGGACVLAALGHKDREI